MNCPRCGQELNEQDRSGIAVDACRGCRGIWLDRGEIDKIIARESSYHEDEPDQDYDDDFLAEGQGRGGRRRARRGGFFANLMDMFGE